MDSRIVGASGAREKQVLGSESFFEASDKEVNIYQGV